MSKRFLTFTAASVLAWSASAQLFTFEFTGSPTGDNQFNQVTSQPQNATVSPITRNGISFFQDDNVHASSDWKLGSDLTPDPTKYLGFSVTAQPGHLLNLDSLSFDYDRLYGVGAPPTAHGPRALRLSWYANGATEETGGFTRSDLGGTLSLISGSTTTFFNADLQGVQGVEFRIFGFRASDSLGVISFDDISVTGSISPVPEPHEYALFFGFGLLGFAVIRRRGWIAA